ncbi:hypothetical protein D3C76_1108270 [compost metagenome]
MEALFFTDFHHRSGIGAVRGTTQGYLIDDGGTVDQPADHTNVSPVQRWIIEDGGVLHLTREHLLVDILAGAAEGFRRAVQIKAVPGFILDFRQ